MTQIPQDPLASPGADEPHNLQGYQDDFDTSRKDQFANEAGSDPSEDVPATRAEFRQGMRDTAISDQEGGIVPTSHDAEPSLATADDYREDIEGRDKDSSTDTLGGDDKSRAADSWR